MKPFLYLSFLCSSIFAISHEMESFSPTGTPNVIFSKTEPSHTNDELLHTNIEPVHTNAGKIDFSQIDLVAKIPGLAQHLSRYSTEEGWLVLDNESHWRSSDVSILSNWSLEDELFLTQNEKLLTTHRFALVNPRLQMAIPIKLECEPLPVKETMFFIDRIDLANQILKLSDGSEYMIHQHDQSALSQFLENDRVLLGVNISEFDQLRSSPYKTYLFINTRTQTYIRGNPIGFTRQETYEDQYVPNESTSPLVYAKNSLKTDAGHIDFGLIEAVEKMEGIAQHLLDFSEDQSILVLSNRSQWDSSHIKGLRGWSKEDELFITQNEKLFSTHRFALVNPRLHKAVPIRLKLEPIPVDETMAFIVDIKEENLVATLSTGLQCVVHPHDQTALSEFKLNDRVLIGINHSFEPEQALKEHCKYYILVNTRTNTYIRMNPVLPNS